MALRQKNVYQDLSGDYSSTASAIATEAATGQNDFEFTCQGSIGPGVFTGFSSGSTMLIKAKVGEENDGSSSTGTNMTSTTSAVPLSIPASPAMTYEIRDIRLIRDNSTNGNCVTLGVSGGSQVTMTRCFVDNQRSGQKGIELAGSSGVNHNYQVRNTVIVTTAGIGLQSWSNSYVTTFVLDLFNNTVDTNGGTKGFYILDVGSEGSFTSTMRNNVAIGSTLDYDIGVTSGTHNHSYNASEDASADDDGATGALVSQTPGDMFVADTAKDYTLKAGSNLIEAGLDLTGTFTDSLNNVTRSAPISMGAMEVSTEPEIKVSGGTGVIEITNGQAANLANTTDGTDFGDNDENNIITNSYVIGNTGDANLNLTGSPKVAISGANAGDWALDEVPSSPVAAAGSTTYTLQFQPQGLGYREALITIDNNDVDENPTTYYVVGNGVTGGFDVSDSAKITIAFGVESTAGTASTATYDELNLLSESLKATSRGAQSQTLNAKRQVMANRRVAVDVGGGINYELQYGVYDTLFAAAIGGAFDTEVAVINSDTGVSAADSDNSFNHAGWDTDPVAGQWIQVAGFVTAANNGIFRIVSATSLKIVVEGGTLVTEAATPAVSIDRGAECVNGVVDTTYTIDKTFTDLTQKIHRYLGMAVDGFAININTEALIDGNVSFIGMEKENIPTSARGGTNAQTNHIVLSAAEAVTAVVSNGDVITVTQFSLTLNRNTRRRPEVGSVNTTGVQQGTFNVSGNINLYWTGQAYVDNVLNFVDIDMGIVITDTAGNVMVINLPHTNLMDDNIVTKGQDTYYELETPFESVENVAEDTTIRLVRWPA